MMEDMKPASKWQMMLEDLASQFPAAQSAVDEIKDIIGGGEEPAPEEEAPPAEESLDEAEMPVSVNAVN